MSGQAVRFPLVIQVHYDEELETPTLGDEDFLEAASKWEESEQAQAAARSEELTAELEEVE